MPCNGKLFMEKIKKVIRAIVWICLIMLAGIGMGISGGVPIPFMKSRRDSEKEKIEEVMNEDQNGENVSQEKL